MRRIALFVLLFFTITLNAQRGKNGPVTIAATQIVNEYTTLTADIAAGATSITVANSTLNANGRFSTNLATGDLVMIIQMQGATILGAPTSKFLGNANTATPEDSTFGGVTAYNNCGNYEFAEVLAVPNATTIQFDCGLLNNYTAAGRVQVVRVPRYSTLTISAGGVIKCDPWDSAKGGIVSIEVLGNTTINGSINVDSAGFRGGQLSALMDSSHYGVNNTAENALLMSWGKLKGEGIAGYGWVYDGFGGKYGKGSAANGGGGADAHNAGGGGGSNGGTLAGWVAGYGVPDVSTANNISAWKLEYSWLSAFKGQGGGRGGYTFSSKLKDPTTTAPNNVGTWGGDGRAAQGGWGGRPLDYSTGKIFMGGGGGAGDQDDDVGGPGGNGGGIVYLMSYGTVAGTTGVIYANGRNGWPSKYNSTSNAGDGAGGAGAGGTVIINSTGNISGIAIHADGGTGGNQIISAATIEAEGPGGGGGGGYIGTSNAGITETVAGGANGTTNATTMKKFPPNGATGGSVGTTAIIIGFQIVAKNDTICSGQTASLSASITGTPPGGTTLSWYSTSSGGSAIATGANYTTGPLTKDTVIYVSTCPGYYRQPVNVIITGSSSISISSPATICTGGNTTLAASGGTAYTWSPAASLNNSTIANPVASPTVTTTYTVSITTPCGKVKDSVVITVTSSPTVTTTASPTSSLCPGGTTNLSATGGSAYAWSPSAGLSNTAISNPIASPTVTTTYTVNITTACGVKKDSIVITANPKPSVTVTPPSPSICAGGNAGLTANGASTYTWSPFNTLSASTGSAVTATPTTTTTYSVIGTSAAGCADTAKVVVTVGSGFTLTITGKDSICSGSSTALTVSGGSTYAWSPSAGLNNTAISNPVASPTVTTIYKVSSTSGSCSATDSIKVIVSPAFKPTITGNNSICSGSSTILTASGGGTYLWSNSTSSTSASITVNPVSTSTYSVTVTNGSCKPDTSIVVTVNAMPTPTVTPAQTICAGTATTLTAGGGLTYTWSPAAGLSSTNTNTVSASPSATTAYTVIVANGGCVAKDSVKVTVDPQPVGNASGSTTITAGQTTPITISPIVAGETYSWTPAIGLSCTTCPGPNASPTVTTTYFVAIRDSVGCLRGDSVQIIVNENCGQVFIPGAFSPGQVNNSVLYVRGDCIKTMDFVVFDRWGNKVFESTDPSSGWNGEYNNKPMNAGTYVYYLHALSIYNDNIEQKGTVTLVR
jgi:gliding motility-associated-like protein